MPQMYSEPSQTSKMLLSAEIIEAFHLLVIFAKGFILDVQSGSEWSSVYRTKMVVKFRLPEGNG